MRNLSALIWLAAILPGCAMGDYATRQFVGDQVMKAAEDASVGNYTGAVSSGIASMVAAIWGVNKMRDRARRARNEPTGKSAPS